MRLFVGVSMNKEYVDLRLKKGPSNLHQLRTYYTHRYHQNCRDENGGRVVSNILNMAADENISFSDFAIDLKDSPSKDYIITIKTPNVDWCSIS